MKTVILDIDGTLVDSNDAHAHAWVAAFAAAGITVDYDKVRRSIGMGGDKLMPAVAGIESDSKEGQRISKARGEIFEHTYLPALRPFASVPELIERFIADGYGLAVASSAKEEELQPLLHVPASPISFPIARRQTTPTIPSRSRTSSKLLSKSAAASRPRR